MEGSTEGTPLHLPTTITIPIFTLGPNDKYLGSNPSTTHCYDNISISPAERIRSAEELNMAFKFYHGWILLPMATLGFVFTSVFILAVYMAIKQKRLSRKSYTLLINRALGDLLAATLGIAIAIYVLTTERVNRDVMQLADVFFAGVFWSATVSYVSLSMLKLYAIARPLHYRNKVTMMRCIYLSILSWWVLKCGAECTGTCTATHIPLVMILPLLRICFLLMTIYALTSTALTKIPSLNAWSGCKMETCLRPMYRIRNSFVVIDYVLIITAFVSTAVLVRRAGLISRELSIQQSTRYTHNGSTANGTSVSAAPPPRPRNRFPLWKLALNVGTFAFFNLPYVVWAIRLLLNMDPCYYARHLILMTTLLGLVRASLLLRIIMDPILGFLTDVQVRRSMMKLLHLNWSRVFPVWEWQARSEENSSDYQQSTRSSRLKGSYSKASRASKNGNVFAMVHRLERAGTGTASNPTSIKPIGNEESIGGGVGVEQPPPSDKRHVAFISRATQRIN